MFDDRWQLISRDTGDVFGIIRGDATWLSTVEMPYLGGTFHAPDDYNYESCIFFKEPDSEVLARYKTKDEAIEGHNLLAKKYNLR